MFARHRPTPLRKPDARAVRPYLLHFVVLVDAKRQSASDAPSTPCCSSPRDLQGCGDRRFQSQPFGPARPTRRIHYRRGLGRALNPNTLSACPTDRGMHPLLELHCTSAGLAVFECHRLDRALWRTTRKFHLGIVPNPSFIDDQSYALGACTLYEGRKVIGSTRWGDLQKSAAWNAHHASIAAIAGLPRPRTVANARMPKCSQETGVPHLTGEALQNASDVRTWLGWRRKYRCMTSLSAGRRPTPNGARQLQHIHHGWLF